MGVPDGSSSKRGKEAGVKDAPYFIFAAEFRSEDPMGPSFGKYLIESNVSLDEDIGAHEIQPATFFLGREYEGC
jgi:hypothetical protein